MADDSLFRTVHVAKARIAEELWRQVEAASQTRDPDELVDLADSINILRSAVVHLRVMEKEAKVADEAGDQFGGDSDSDEPMPTVV